MTKPTLKLVQPAKTQSACASSQSDQSLHWSHVPTKPLVYPKRGKPCHTGWIYKLICVFTQVLLKVLPCASLYEILAPILTGDYFPLHYPQSLNTGSRDVTAEFVFYFFIIIKLLLILSAQQTKTNYCTNNLDPDETARTVSSGSTLFAILFLSLDWNLCLHQWTSPNSRMGESTWETQGLKHYENTLFQIYWKFHQQNLKVFG